MVSWNLVDIGSGNDLLPDYTEPELMQIFDQWNPMALIWEEIACGTDKHQMYFSVVHLNLQPHLPGASDLKVVTRISGIRGH